MAAVRRTTQPEYCRPPRRAYACSYASRCGRLRSRHAAGRWQQVRVPRCHPLPSAACCAAARGAPPQVRNAAAAVEVLRWRAQSDAAHARGALFAAFARARCSPQFHDARACRGARHRRAGAASGVAAVLRPRWHRRRREAASASDATLLPVRRRGGLLCSGAQHGAAVATRRLAPRRRILRQRRDACTRLTPHFGGVPALAAPCRLGLPLPRRSRRTRTMVGCSVR